MSESTKQFSFRVTDEQKTEIEKQAEAYGISATTLVKRRVLGIPPSDMADLNQIANDVREYKAAVIRAEFRINEIAHACCGRNAFSGSDYQEIKDLLNQLQNEYAELIRGIRTGSHHGSKKDVSKENLQTRSYKKSPEQDQKEWGFNPDYLDDLRIT